MYGSLQRLASLPDDTALYCGHEYTLANARFAVHAEPDNPAIAARLGQGEQMRSAGQVTLPTTVAEERATNPFVRASDWQEFARLRAQKDSFR
jgi:hydroxyacylglutathione hydrolase